MHGYIFTKHFQERAQQRSISSPIVSALLKYGEARSSKCGIDSLIFTTNTLAEIKSDCGPSVFKMCEKFKNPYIIMSDDGALITVARSYRRSVH